MGYKQHTGSDGEGRIEKVYAPPPTPTKANISLLQGLGKGVRVYADKGYGCQNNCHALAKKRLFDDIMEKAYRGSPLSAAQKRCNKGLSTVRYVVEQSFGTLHRKFRHSRASYFGVEKVTAQCRLRKRLTGQVCLLPPEKTEKPLEKGFGENDGNGRGFLTGIG